LTLELNGKKKYNRVFAPLSLFSHE